MTTLTLRVDDALNTMLVSAAHDAGVSVSTFVKDHLKNILTLTKPRPKTPSFMRFAGCLSHAAAKDMLKFNREAPFSQIEADMWNADAHFSRIPLLSIEQI